MALATMTCPLFGKKHGKTMGKYGNTHGKRWEIHGNPWTQWKFLSWENHGTKGWIFQDGIFQPRLPDMAFHAAEIVGFDCSQHVQWKSTGEHSERYWEGMGKSWDVRNHAGKTLWKLTEIVENGFKTRKTLDFFIETFWTIQVGMKKISTKRCIKHLNLHKEMQIWRTYFGETWSWPMVNPQNGGFI